MIGERVPFSVTVKNVGNVATPPDTILDVLFTVDVDTPNAADIGWSDNITVPLAPGESRTQVVNGGPDGSDGLWMVDEGAHNVRAYVNSGSLPVRPPITEITRENNFYLESFTVQGPARTDQIVFVGPFGGIWRMASDGTQLRQLTSDGVQPEVSRDGQRIAYVRVFPGFLSTIWVMNADGSDQHEVYVPPSPLLNCPLCPQQPPSRGAQRDRSPSWSPDGSEIAFIRNSAGAFPAGAFVMRSDGTGQTRSILTCAQTAASAQRGHPMAPRSRSLTTT